MLAKYFHNTGKKNLNKDTSKRKVKAYENKAEHEHKASKLIQNKISFPVRNWCPTQSSVKIKRKRKTKEQAKL